MSLNFISEDNIEFILNKNKNDFNIEKRLNIDLWLTRAYTMFTSLATIMFHII